MFVKQHEGGNTGNNDEKRDEHLGNGADQRGIPGGGGRFGRHGALNDQKVGAPVAKGEHEP